MCGGTRSTALPDIAPRDDECRKEKTNRNTIIGNEPEKKYNKKETNIGRKHLITEL